MNSELFSWLSGGATRHEGLIRTLMNIHHSKSRRQCSQYSKGLSYGFCDVDNPQASADEQSDAIDIAGENHLILHQSTVVHILSLLGGVENSVDNPILSFTA